uniref:Uncharacterized protein n=1 Tax=Alexandrium monilatum TaxID=311494 RepID=A0A7S4VRA7_9DINO|mmetsp:Transcript_53314/g.167649  ORF Transcript_53314/g.167649 Transcript_53314/m.167649 type:complete len:597 (+) Transcript_53314:61-1851(+)
MRSTASTSAASPTHGETLVSTAFLEQPPAARQTTQAELWGMLPASGPAEQEWGHSSFMSDDSEVGGEEEESVIHEGVLLNRLSDVCIRSVAVGAGHVVFLAESGFALSYGRNHRGQLGVGDATSRDQPEPVLFTGCLAPSSVVIGSLERVIAHEDEKPNDPSWTISAVACGNDHTLFLSRRPSGGAQVFACGAWEALGMEGVTDDQPIALGIRQLFEVTAIAARRDASCCAVPEPAGEGSGGAGSGAHLLYFWGEVGCCLVPSYYAEPTPLYRTPRRIDALGLGAFFGLALDEVGSVYAWGDGTYGELGGAEEVQTDTFKAHARVLDSAELPEPGCVLLPPLEVPEGSFSINTTSLHTADPAEAPASDHGSAAPDSERGSRERRPRVIDIACGERHSLLLDESGRVFAFGENLAGQCGVPEVVGAGHITGNTVPRPRQVPVEGPRRGGAGCRHGPARPSELGARVFAGWRHSAMVTRDHRLYIWGHPANRKLGHAGFNPDGTEAGDRPSKKRPPGVAVRSALRDAVRRPRFVYSLLHRRVKALGLGEECTVIVTGDGATGSEVPSAAGAQEDVGSPRREAPMDAGKLGAILSSVSL